MSDDEKQLEARRRAFARQIKSTPLHPDGVPGSTLSVPCRPAYLDRDDLPLSFEGSFSGQSLAPEWTLIHGYLPGKGEPDEPYAWLEHEGLGVIYDVELDRCYTTADFYAQRKAVLTNRYDWEAAARLCANAGHHGPWFPGEDLNPYTGEQIRPQ